MVRDVKKLASFIERNRDTQTISPNYQALDGDFPITL